MNSLRQYRGWLGVISSYRLCSSLKASGKILTKATGQFFPMKTLYYAAECSSNHSSLNYTKLA